VKGFAEEDRDWLLFTDEQPQVPVWPHSTLQKVRRARQRKEHHDYIGSFTSVRRYVLDTFAKGLRLSLPTPSSAERTSSPAAAAGER
jgi:hypothetical protein